MLESDPSGRPYPATDLRFAHTLARLEARLTMNRLTVVIARGVWLGFGLGSATAHAEPIGEVDTVFKFVGPDHKIVVDAHDDPKVKGVTCYVSRAKTGGIKGAVGLAEDKSEASIACRQVGPITFTGPLPVQEEVFNQRISLIFKKLRVVRMVDKTRNALVYLTYSDRVIEGSPQNSVTAVPVDAANPIPLR
jgi:CreA protein